MATSKYWLKSYRYARHVRAHESGGACSTKWWRNGETGGEEPSIDDTSRFLPHYPISVALVGRRRRTQTSGDNICSQRDCRVLMWLYGARGRLQATQSKRMILNMPPRNSRPSRAAQHARSCSRKVASKLFRRYSTGQGSECASVILSVYYAQTYT